MEREILMVMQERLVKSLLDILILAQAKGNSMSGYDVIQCIHEEFGFIISPGTVYSFLYSMEREGLLEGTWNNRRRDYTLTDKGKETIRAIQSVSGSIQKFIGKILQAK